jgi:hypothetical protein
MPTKTFDNMVIWNAVCETDKKFTKPVSYGKRKYTAIDAQSQIMAATKLFGPMGIGWGFKDEQIFVILDIIVYQAVFWYIHEGRAGEFPMSSSVRADKDDAVKKVCTDAITKSLARLGFNADVFLGRFDDNKYVAGQRGTPAPNHAATNTEAKKNEGIAAQRAKEAEKGEKTRGEINTMVFEAECAAHENQHERDASRLKHLGYDNLTSPDINKMRSYYAHLQTKIKEKADAVTK